MWNNLVLFIIFFIAVFSVSSSKAQNLEWGVVKVRKYDYSFCKSWVSQKGKLTSFRLRNYPDHIEVRYDENEMLQMDSNWEKPKEPIISWGNGVLHQVTFFRNGIYKEEIEKGSFSSLVIEGTWSPINKGEILMTPSNGITYNGYKHKICRYEYLEGERIDQDILKLQFLFDDSTYISPFYDYVQFIR